MVKRTALLVTLLAAASATIAGDSLSAASSYPSPLELRSTASAVTGSWKLDSSTGSADSTTSNTPGDGATGWYAFDPGAAVTTQLGSIPTTADGKGWIVDPAGGVTGFPAGTWTFTVQTDIPDATLTAGAAVLTVGIWKGTISGSSFTATGTILTPTDDPSAQNLRTAVTPVTTSVSYSVPKVSLAAGETLYVDFWRHQTAGISDATATRRELDFTVNDGVAQLTHPAADDTGPTHAVTVTAVSGSTYHNSSTSTLYYNGGTAGSFKLNDAITDAGAGPYSVTYPLVSTSGWTHASETVTTGPSYQSSTYSWTAGSTTSPGSQTITGEDAALQTSTATLTLTNDTTAPSGQTAALSGGPWYASASVPLTLGGGTDAGSGVDATRGVVERASATLTNGVCGTFGTFSSVTLAGGADTTVQTGKCYRYQYKASDNVGNLSAASAASGDAKVDTTAPGTPALRFSGFVDGAATGSTVFYRPRAGAGFTVSVSSTDPESGVSGWTFPEIAELTTAGTGASRTYRLRSTTRPAQGPHAVTVANGAGASSAAASFSLVADSAGPVVTVRCNRRPCSSRPYAKAVAVTITATDGAGSGVGAIRYTTSGADPTADSGEEYQQAFTIASQTRLKVRAYDKTGNASRLVSLLVRSLGDRLSFSAPKLLRLARGSRYLRARVVSSDRASVTATMTGPGLKRPERWRFSVSAGTSLVQLKLPAGMRPSRRYTLVWSARAGERKATKTTKVLLGLPKASK